MIAVEAALVAEASGIRMRIDGKDQRVICRLNGNPLSMIAALGRSPGILRALRALLPVLTASGLRLDVIAGRVLVARAGFGVRQNALGRLLQLPGTSIGS